LLQILQGLYLVPQALIPGIAAEQKYKIGFQRLVQLVIRHVRGILYQALPLGLRGCFQYYHVTTSSWHAVI
jgi:hypothetical protein